MDDVKRKKQKQLPYFLSQVQIGPIKKLKVFTSVFQTFMITLCIERKGI